MMGDNGQLPEILTRSPVRTVYGAGSLAELGKLAHAQGARRVLLVTDPGLEAAGHPLKAQESLEAAGVDVHVFDGVQENPTTRHVRAGVAFAREVNPDWLVAVGGGSSMDCAKGINLVLTNGGEIADYWGIDKPTEPMLPFIAVPTTAGTGSEAQSFALITDEHTHQKMACGDSRLPQDGGLRPHLAILDPKLTRTQPPTVAAAAGIDAVAHAVETAATTKRNKISRSFSMEAWRLLDAAFETAMRDPDNDEARSGMLLGAHLAGAAIENSMLGAAHACANPLTAKFGIVHGVAVGIMLPHVVRYNASSADNPYADIEASADRLAERIESFLDAGNHPRSLAAVDVPAESLPALAESAAKQWTATFNPVPVGAAELLDIYRRALE